MEQLEKIKNLIKKYHVFEKDGNLGIDKNIFKSSDDLNFAKTNKQTIINFLLRQRTIREEKEKIEEVKRIKSYDFLVKKLAALNFPKGNDDNIKYVEIMNNISTKFYTGPEDDGLNLALTSENSRLRKEARKYCLHNWEIEYDYNYTEDSRKQVIRRGKCTKCGMLIKHSVSETIDIETIRRI